MLGLCLFSGALVVTTMTATASAQAPALPQGSKPADFTVDVDGLIVAEFSARISAYRFLDRDLILYDTRANMMLDRITAAIRCSTPR